MHIGHRAVRHIGQGFFIKIAVRRGLHSAFATLIEFAHVIQVHIACINQIRRVLRLTGFGGRNRAAQLPLNAFRTLFAEDLKRLNRLIEFLRSVERSRILFGVWTNHLVYALDFCAQPAVCEIVFDKFRVNRMIRLEIRFVFKNPCDHRSIRNISSADRRIDRRIHRVARAGR